jgi:hypothetical protein
VLLLNSSSVLPKVWELFFWLFLFNPHTLQHIATSNILVTSKFGNENALLSHISPGASVAFCCVLLHTP